MSCTKRSTSRHAILFLLGLACCNAASGQAIAPPVGPPVEATSQIEMRPVDRDRLLVIRSDHFELVTDLELREAKHTLDQLETVVSNLGVYWGRPLPGKLKCFVVVDATKWPAELLANPTARASLAAKSGVVLFAPAGGAAQTEIYATADGSTPQREAVRAFCLQTFGRTGPDWFIAGLTEVGANWQIGGGRHCPQWMTEQLRSDTAPSPSAIVSNRVTTLTPQQAAAHRWALCYMLSTHPTYSARFRQFGLDQMLGRPVDFVARFPEIGPQLDADYRSFLAHVTIDRKSIAAADNNESR